MTGAKQHPLPSPWLFIGADGKPCFNDAVVGGRSVGVDAHAGLAHRSMAS
jgi:hypothetical protein